MKCQEDGFTLVETLLTLFVVSLTVLIPILSIDRMIEHMQIDLFFREATANITRMQNHAILNGESTQIEFVNQDGNQYINFVIPHNRSHPASNKIEIDSPYYKLKTGKSNYTKYVKYHHTTGNISDIGTVHFETTTGNYKLTFWLGSGRFEISKTSEK